MKNKTERLKTPIIQVPYTNIKLNFYDCLKKKLFLSTLKRKLADSPVSFLLRQKKINVVVFCFFK